jgi:hypothetical protein
VVFCTPSHATLHTEHCTRTLKTRDGDTTCNRVTHLLRSHADPLPCRAVLHAFFYTPRFTHTTLHAHGDSLLVALSHTPSHTHTHHTALHTHHATPHAHDHNPLTTVYLPSSPYHRCNHTGKSVCTDIAAWTASQSPSLACRTLAYEKPIRYRVVMIVAVVTRVHV